MYKRTISFLGMIVTRCLFSVWDKKAQSISSNNEKGLFILLRSAIWSKPFHTNTSYSLLKPWSIISVYESTSVGKQDYKSIYNQLKRERDVSIPFAQSQNIYFYEAFQNFC